MSDSGSTMKPRNPSAVMRDRHPDLFSDSVVDATTELPKAVFEYHLDTLTSRKQEVEFEHFCRKLAESEICPNLRVQTGPTGGGDSKTDTETYPVAQSISERWWVGSPSSGGERWAFAFSAKRKWKGKAKADIENIVSTKRGHAHIYFITNQFVKDKERAIEEDKLSALASVPVHILDRSWIIDKVYGSHHLEMAIGALGIVGAQTKTLVRSGPRDAERTAELEALDKQVADPMRYEGARYQLAEDCLQTAMLARSLERPRSEVEARFVQADRLAKEVNYAQQRLRISYAWAWTLYWWYEDYSSFSELYERVESYAAESTLASDVKLLHNLWQLLPASIAAKHLSAKDARITERLNRLTSLLTPIAADSTRPTNSLEARTSLILLQMTVDFQSGNSSELDKRCKELSQILDESRQLSSYPIETLFSIVSEIGNVLDSEEFDELYEKLVDAIQQRRSDGAAGKAYCDRAFQKLHNAKYYEAIRWFGRAEERLIKEEYRADLVRALLGSGWAFEQAGLLWASRNKTLAAAERTLAVFRSNGKVIAPALIALQRLVWIELRIGRVPHVLNVIELASAVSAALQLSGERAGQHKEDFVNQDSVLGIHFLNLPIKSLPSVSRLHDALASSGLFMAALALLYSLGQTQAARDEGYLLPNESDEEVAKMFKTWLEQPAVEQLPSEPFLMEGETSALSSIILGCKIVVITPNNPISMGIAESLLGSLEAFLATSSERDVMPHLEEYRIELSVSAEIKGTPEVSLVETPGPPSLKIRHRDDYSSNSIDQALSHLSWIQNTIIKILCRIALVRDVEGWLKKIADDERGFSRAISLGDVITLNGNVFGNNPPIRIHDRIRPGARDFPPLRTERIGTVRRGKQTSTEPRFGDGPPPEDLLDTEKLKHSDRRVLSPIDAVLWDRARWRGTMFASYPDGYPPVLGLAYQDADAGDLIFQQWIQRWGRSESDSELRVAIITGISSRNPSAYTVIVGPSFKGFSSAVGTIFLSVSRVNQMEPSTRVNLDQFLETYRRVGAYYLAPAHMKSDTEQPDLFMHSSMLRRQLDVREAWQIGENDPDAVALRDDDPPIVPADVRDAPVYKAIERMRSRRRS